MTAYVAGCLIAFFSADTIIDCVVSKVKKTRRVVTVTFVFIKLFFVLISVNMFLVMFYRQHLLQFI